MFCVKCGAQMPDGAKFCQNCGAPAAPANQGGTAQPPQPPYVGGQPGYQMPRPANQRPKWLIPVIAGAVVVALVIGIVMVSTVIGSLAKTDTGESSSAPTVTLESEVPSAEEPALQHYENSEVKFSIDYPEDFSLSEPNVNNVLLGKGDQCRVAVEYAYATTKNCFIYSAEDFAEQIEEDPSLLSGWVGADSVTLRSDEPDEQDINGLHSYVYNWELSLNGDDYTGGLYIFDSKGEFGCYTFLWMVEQGSEQEETYTRQAMDILDSFTVTGPHEAEGYTIYECEEPDYLRFALRDELVEGDMELGYDGGSSILANYIRIYPAEKGSSQIGMYTPSYQEASADPKEDKFNSAMSLAVNAPFHDPDYKEAQFLSEPTRLEIGRYPFVELDLQCRYTGFGSNEEQRRCVVLFPRDGTYWQVELISTEENLEQTSNVLGDFLMSLRVEDDGLEDGEDAFGTLSEFTAGMTQSSSQADFNQVVDEILTKIENSKGFMPADSYYKPLVSFTDVDGNGVHELMCLYKIEGDGAPYAVYDIYSVQADGSYIALETREELYHEVGGNSGSIGIVVDKAKTPYLKLETKTPQADKFNNNVLYIPWGGSQTELEKDGRVYFESHGIYGEEDKGSYFVGDDKVDRAAFEARQTEFISLWTDLNLNSGPGNGGNNVDFDGIRRHFDLNTDSFGTA